MGHQLKISIFFIFMINFVYAKDSAPTCSRKAIFNNKEILIDGYTGARGSGLNKIMRSNPKALKHLSIYQNANDIQTFNLLSGTISTTSLITGLLYTGDRDNKNNFILFGGIVALINFLTTKTIQFYNERELTLAIEEYNKTSVHQIRRLDVSTKKQNKPSIFINKNWSF